MMFSPIRRLYKQYLRTGAVEAMCGLAQTPVRRAAEARWICRQLCAAADFRTTSVDDFRAIISPLHVLLGLFHRPASMAAGKVLLLEGIPQLLNLYDDLLHGSEAEKAVAMFDILEIFVFYESERGVERLIDAIRNDDFPEHDEWRGVFEQCADHDAVGVELCARLKDSLPAGRLAVYLLELANQLADRRLLAEHPFDSECGRSLLSDWLRAGEDSWSDALHAADALLYLNPDARHALIGLALDHEGREIQMAGARAAASTGSPAALQTLARFCLDRLCSREACQYLEEFGRSDLIPEKALQPDFRAECDLCRWLAYPTQFGCEPDEIELFDTRELYWPPTSDRRRLWLFRYAYRGTPEDDAPIIGIGLSGSRNVALDSVSPEMSPEEIYARHCFWELDDVGGPWSRGDRPEIAGREMLQRYNEDF